MPKIFFTIKICQKKEDFEKLKTKIGYKIAYRPQIQIRIDYVIHIYHILIRLLVEFHFGDTITPCKKINFSFIA